MNSKSLLVEARVLREIQRGSFEDMLSNLDSAVSENEEKFGDEAILFASFPDHLVVLNEQGEFFSVGYKLRDGVVLLSEDVSHIIVPVLAESDVAGHGVDSFFEGKSLAGTLRSLVSISQKQGVLDDVKSSISRLMEDGQIWRSYIEKNKETVARYAWDAKYGSLIMGIKPMFEDVYAEGVDESSLEEKRETVESGLFGLESRLKDIIDEVSESLVIYADKKADMSTDMSEFLEQFDDFSADYVGNITDVVGFLSEAIQKAKNGCVMCSALVHDEVARRFELYELGGRFIRKIASELE